MSRFLCLLFLVGISSCLSQVLPPFGCMDPFGRPGQRKCLNGYWSLCSCRSPYGCNWINNGEQCRESGSPVKPKPPPDGCRDPPGFPGQRKCIDGTMKVCYCTPKGDQCRWSRESVYGKPCIDFGAPFKSSDSALSLATSKSCSIVVCRAKLVSAILICIKEFGVSKKTITCIKETAIKKKLEKCLPCLCAILKKGNKELGPSLGELCCQQLGGCGNKLGTSASDVAQSGLEVALAINSPEINDCTFVVTFDPNVCDNLQSVAGKVDEKNFVLPIDPDNTRLCKITKITSTCNILAVGEVDCGQVTNPPAPPSPFNYVFEFQPSVEGCVLVQQ